MTQVSPILHVLADVRIGGFKFILQWYSSGHGFSLCRTARVVRSSSAAGPTSRGRTGSTCLQNSSTQRRGLGGERLHASAEIRRVVMIKRSRRRIRSAKLRVGA